MESGLTESRHRLAGAALIMMAAITVSRLTGVLREMVIAYQFGTGREYEAYLAGNRIPDFIFQVVAGGAVASAFIPVFTGYLARNQREEGWKMVSTLFNLGIAILVPICALLMAFSPQVIHVIAPEFDSKTSALAADLARVMLLSPIFFTIGCFVTSVLNSHRKFFLASLAPSVYNVGIIGGALFLAKPFGLYGLALGSATGALLFLLVQVPGLVQVRMAYSKILDIHHPGVRQVGKLMLPRTIGLGVTQINYFVTLILASGLAERYAALNYAWTLTMMPLGIFAMAISTAVFPTLATQGALDQMADLRRTMTGALRLILYLTIPASVGLIVLRYPIIQLLFQRGLFDASSTEWTAFALQFYAAALFAQSATEIVTRAFYALQDTRTPVIVAVATMVVNVALSLILVQFLSHGGLALATSIAVTLEALTLLYIARRRLGGLGEQRLFSSVVKTSIAAVLMGVVVIWFAGHLAPYLDSFNLPQLANRLLFVGASILVGAASYLAFSFVLRSEELMQVRGMLATRLRRDSRH